jgi:hypothetical protein
MRLDAHFDMLPERAFIRGPNGQIQPQGGKGGGGSAPAPDPNIGLAQKQLANLAEAQYDDFMNEIWPELQEQSRHQQAQADKLQDQQMAMADKNSAIADEYYDRMKEKFYPLQDKIVQEAMDYNEEGNFQTMANRAMGDVNAQNEIARKNQALQMAQYGVNPASGAYAGANQAINTMGAANAAAASNRAYTAAKELGWNMGMTASGLGAALPGQQVNSSGVAMNAGNSALAAGQIPMQNTLASSGAMNSAYGGAMQGWGQVGNLGVQNYNTQVNAWSAQQQANARSSAGFGNFAGQLGAAAIQAYATKSDVRVKENITFVGELPSGVRLYEFEYREPFKDDPGCGHGRQIGVIAQQLMTINPSAVTRDADGYYVVDYSKVN